MLLKFVTEPPSYKHILLDYSQPRVLLITLDRPNSLNCMKSEDHFALDSIFKWFDSEPSLNVAILTGNGRAFCAGADLKEWSNNIQSEVSWTKLMPTTGFGGLSRRCGKKPVIAAVNGLCFGGGCEMIINSDLVIADEMAQFALPEVKIGVVPIAGALTRLIRTVGKQRAMEMSLTGRTLKAEEAKEWGLVNKVVANRDCIKEARKMAEMISDNSPDSVIITRRGVNMGWEGYSVEDGTRLLEERCYPQVNGGQNMKEGLESFVKKRKPVWVPSKL